MFSNKLRSSKSAHRANGAFPEFEIYFQPIVDLRRETIYAYEALCRGLQGDSYTQIVAEMQAGPRAGFDKLAMKKSLRLAAELGLERRGARISLNVGPAGDVAGVDAAYVVRMAKHYGIEASSLMLEITEDIRMNCVELSRIVDSHREAGMVVAIDDFGAGYAGLNVLATCSPDMVKLDRELVKGIESSFTRKTIVAAFVNVCEQLGVRVLAEGVETIAECKTLRGLGIDLMQGYLFACPVSGEAPGAYSGQSFADGSFEALDAAWRGACA